MTPSASMPYAIVDGRAVPATSVVTADSGTSYKTEPTKSRQDRPKRKAGKRPAKTAGRNKR